MNAPAIKPGSQIAKMAQRLSVEPEEMHNIIVNTVMPNGGRGITNEQFVSFLMVANEYKLNPISREIYAFPAKGGGIQPIVSIDGWLNIINGHPQFDGMDIEFSESKIEIGGKQLPEWCKCSIYRKDRNRPVVVVEYMEECYRQTDPWRQKGRRMLQHKTVIQGARYAFGISGIIDEDEKESYKDMGVIQAETPAAKGQVIEQQAEPATPEKAGNIEAMTMMLDIIDTANNLNQLNQIAEQIKADREMNQVEKQQIRAAWKARKGEIEAES